MLLTADRVLVQGELRSDMGIDIAPDGRIRRVGPLAALGRPDRTLTNRVLLPGFVNAHSHAFQRLLRGRTQVRRGDDDFWSWRSVMYQVASRLDPDRLFVAARQAFLEMALSGITTVGEFHYLHHAPDGSPYDDPSAMGLALAAAALEVGIRPCIIRAIYLRGDFDRAPEKLQLRFCERDLEVSWARVEQLIGSLRAMGDPRVSWALAAHSIRAVSLDDIIAIKTCASHLPLHIHASEQRREVQQCRQAYGATPVRLFAERGVLDGGTTLVHGTHLYDGEAELVAQSGALVCICPTTEADLGDGLVAAEELARHGVDLCLGTDGQTSSSLLAEAGRLESHERLRLERRNVLAGPSGDTASALLAAAGAGGGRALQMDVGEIVPGSWADFVSYELDDPHLAGCDDGSLLAALLFSADSRAVADVIVGGRFIVQDGVHPLAATSTRQYAALCRDLFAAG